MILRTLRLRSFRAHDEITVELRPKVNLLHGANGVGKTNVLEAIHYVCLTKSFTATNDRYVVRQDAPYFEVEGLFEGVRSTETRVRLVYVPSEGKKVFVNGAPLDRLTELVGMLPVVVFSPEDHALTAEGPSERRRFLNNILSQARPVYMDDLMKYRRARKQRNEVLRQYKKRPNPPPEALIEPWTEKIVTIGSRVIHRRNQFLHTFRTYLVDAYERIDAVAEEPTIEYDTIDAFAEATTESEIQEAFRSEVERKREHEHQRGTTLVGPQRDELVFRLDDLEVRRYGSQGQHRTFAMALKLAQYLYLTDRLDTQPILLLDDAFGKLDARRTDVFLELLMSDVIGQSLITATRRSPFAKTIDFEKPVHRSMHVTRVDGAARVTPEHNRGEDDRAKDTSTENAPAGASTVSESPLPESQQT
ncbi:DNA replication/repair protein RecF [Longibacter sp.]|jgi:DNA replication and repair protein RecF|uniref:DNA replication/repair protein RecF n=1 Tax=Longibacter sp. TaxID=2045415 RepID=UPI003EC09826